jgi:alpha-glucosidase
MALPPRPWWKDAVVYQIYPASFKDSNDDGIGDISGITQTLDYIRSIGVTAIWICPMYASPQIDMGYDVSDYESVNESYGTMRDMEILIEEAHRHGLRIILDLVVNHTSDQHAWFKSSRSSKIDQKRDWYIWRPAKYDTDGKRQPPNNWRSHFGGSAWTFDEATQEYYLHLFCPEQPDLNWECQATRNAIYQSAMIYWLEKGVDGFRVDSVNMYSKPPGLPDAPVRNIESPWQEAGSLYCNGPRMNEYLEEMNKILASYDAMSVGECPHTPDRQRVVDYVSAKRKRLDMLFQFDCVDVGMGSTQKFATTPFNYTLHDLKIAISKTQSLLDGTDAWITSFIENHDQGRSVSRYGDDSLQWRNRSATLLAMLLASLSGTLYIYQGQEIGMLNMPLDWPIDEYKDVDSLNHYKEVAEQTSDDPSSLQEAKAILQHLARDHARTPMQWTAEANGGFTGAEVTPWMRVNPSAFEGVDVASQSREKSSVLAFWRRILEIRKLHSALMVDGSFSLLDEENKFVLSFVKRSPNQKTCAIVICNFSGTKIAMPSLDGVDLCKGHLVLDNIGEEHRSVDPSGDALEPWEGRLYLLP